ncbi:MAG TPA: hypothetical protein DDY78_15490 [Planctomycetales bacterium]|jgi:hypothetical protein|nr:hypothetical protein [Planctomycetales bacterium]
MNTTSKLTEAFRAAIEHPTRGVVGIVDDLLRLCPEQGLRLDWQADDCLIHCRTGDSEEAIDLPIRKSVFRAILARIAVLCNEQRPNSVSPYGGEGELSQSANPLVQFQVSFTNTPAEQTLELTSKGDPNGEP